MGVKWPVGPYNDFKDWFYGLHEKALTRGPTNQIESRLDEKCGKCGKIARYHRYVQSTMALTLHCSAQTPSPEFEPTTELAAYIAKHNQLPQGQGVMSMQQLYNAFMPMFPPPLPRSTPKMDSIIPSKCKCNCPMPVLMSVGCAKRNEHE